MVSREQKKNGTHIFTLFVLWEMRMFKHMRLKRHVTYIYKNKERNYRVSFNCAWKFLFTYSFADPRWIPNSKFFGLQIKYIPQMRIPMLFPLKYVNGVILTFLIMFL